MKKKIIIWVLSILLGLTTIANVIITYKIKNIDKPATLRVVPYEHYYSPQEEIICNLTKAEVKELLNDIYQTSYTYSEQEYLGENVKGVADVTNKHITLLSDLHTIRYIEVLSHEIVHIKYQTSNETFTEYTSIVTLYESGIETFKKIALNKARLIISGTYENTQYDCGYYLLKYFGEEL